MINKVNIEKMKRNMARSTPDVISRVFGYDDGNQLDEWRDNFIRMMKLKHGANLKCFTAYQEPDYTGRGSWAKVTLESVLYDKARAGRRMKKITLTPEMMDEMAPITTQGFYDTVRDQIRKGL